jgi:hypothetical protein
MGPTHQPPCLPCSLSRTAPESHHCWPPPATPRGAAGARGCTLSSPSLDSSPIRSHRLLFSLFGRPAGAPTTVFLPIADSEAGALLCYSFFVSSSDLSSSPVSGTSPSTPHAENRRLRSLERHCTGHRKGYRRRRPPRVKWNRHHSLILVVPPFTLPDADSPGRPGHSLGPVSSRARPAR